ncbi:MAG: putative transrane permease [Bacteroidetes bacterium]|nr:putative transrane permease [Bacteroidota bacterium]
MKVSVLSIALGMALMILTLAVVSGFQKEIRNKLIGFGAHIQITNYDNNVSDEPQPISSRQDFLDDLKELPQIRHIQSYATKSGIIKTKTDNEGVLLKGIGADYDWSFIEQNLVAGKTFTVSDTGVTRSIVISKLLADKLELKLDDKMVIYFLIRRTDSAENVSYEQRVKTFFISGIYNTGYEDVDKKLTLVDIRQIRKLNYWNEDQVGGFEIAINDYKQIDELGAEVNAIAGQGFVAQTIKETNPTVFSWLDLQDMNAVIVITLMLLVAGINMISVLLILILERTNMIGILKALGAKNKSIRQVFLYNALYLIGKGLFWGNLLGIGIALMQQQFGLFTLDPKTYYISVVPVYLDVATILLLNAGTLVCCLLMLIVPSFIVAKITPVKSIRFS